MTLIPVGIVALSVSKFNFGMKNIHSKTLYAMPIFSDKTRGYTWAEKRKWLRK